MAIKEETLGGTPSRKALASLLGLDTATTFKATADVKDGTVPALSPVVIAADGTATIYTADEASPVIGETDQVGFTVSDRVTDAEGALNVAVMRQAHVRRSRLSLAAQAVLTAAPAAALTHIIVEEA
ncbi:hypothetical protein [Brachybacterium sp. UMB0905]|uniref:hypothetical protein n=1 Tax=Brachybacterium sp. UMB0905 TaxID=2069310 RepID=UPI000C7FA1A1|nr:hypothetical protein [Brachybacterium sp. UMB0905]PMC76402.1 hypothetical protein CJ197_04400 [Brachybacterium sp. UMB0905]